MAQYSVNRARHYPNNNDDLHEVQLLGDKDGNIVNTFGAASNIPLANGDVSGYTAVHKYGSCDGTHGTGWNTVWTGAETDGQQLYPWPAIGAASVVTVVSTSDSDTTNVTLEGLDVNYAFQTETLTLTGTSAVTGSKVFHRVNRAFMTGIATNVGTIIVKNATPTVITEIKAGRGQTLQSFYTVPAGCTGFLSSIQMTSNKSMDVEISMFARPFGGAFRVVGGTFLHRMDHTINYTSPIKLTEKTDIDVRAIGGNNNSISCSFDLVVVENSLLNA